MLLSVGVLFNFVLPTKLVISAEKKSKFEPENGKIYHCAQAEARPVGIFSRHIDWKGIEEYVDACGHRPKLIMHYISFDPFAYWLLKDTISEITEQPYDYIPQIGLDFYSYPPGHGIHNPVDITQNIAKGDYDRAIEELWDLLSAMDIPVFLRPGYEFGGNGQGRHASKKYWIAAWKRIYNIFNDKGANKIAFVWNTLDEIDYMDYYPGDQYVDWWAINIFDNNAIGNELVKRFLIDAQKHRKPVMIAESTPRYVGVFEANKAWSNWFRPFFELIQEYPNIKAFCYINASWRGFPDTTFKWDCRIQSNETIEKMFGDELSKEKYVHSE